MGATFEYNVDLDGFFNRIIARSQSKINAAVDAAVDELFAELKTELKQVYDQVITEFYDEYTGSGEDVEGNTGLFYKRNNSLYDLIQFSTDTEEFAWSFNPDKATELERAPGTVYKLSFLEGWHGGAAGTDKRGESVSLPHWRTPYPYSSRVKDKSPAGFYRWGRKAVQSSTAPYEKWEERRADYIRDNARTKFVTLLQKHIDRIRWF